MPTATQDSPVTLIEGIGPAAQTGLGQIAVHNVFDLLRTSAEDLHAAVDGIASTREVERWRTMAAFLQVEGMTNQWAEALAQAGFPSIESLHQADAADVRSAFDAALASGASPDAPDEDSLTAMRLEFAVLAWSGAVNVTVLDEADSPIRGADVRVGVRHGRTDARGRVRLTRIPLGVRARVVASKDGFQTRTGEVEGLLRDEFHLGVELLRLEAAPTANPEPQRLSEYRGDVLPQLSAHAMTTEAHGEDELRDRDVFMLRRFYRDNTTAQLTSKYLEYEAGRFFALSYRVSRDRLPDGIREREHLLLRRGKFERVAMDALRLDVFKAMRRARAALRGRPPAQTLAEKDARMHAFALEISAQRNWTNGGAR